jgi:hypothetical protein
VTGHEQHEPGSSPEPTSPSDNTPATDTTWLTLLGIIGVVLITLVAGIGRFLQLADLPPGLAEAELQHGLLARQADDFGIRWAIENAGSLSIPLMTVIATIGSLTGFDAETPRIAAALFGTASILFTGLWIFRAMGPLWGIAAAAVLAGSFWHILFSRLAFGSIVATCALAAFCWLLTEAGNRRDQAALPWYLFAGLAAGVGFLSTPALRLLPLVLVGVLTVSIYQLWQQPGPSEARNWLISTAAAYLTISPYLIAHRDDLLKWTPWASTPGLPGQDQTSIPTFASALIETATSLVLPGNTTPELNLPGDPWFSLLMLPWAAIGLLGLIRAWNRPDLQQHFAIGIAVLVSVLIGISATDAGHPGQLVILGPALAALTVTGFRTLITWARVTTVRYALISLAVVGIAGQAVISTQGYVDDWATEPGTREHFNTGVIDALHVTSQLDTSEPVFIYATSYETARDYFRIPARIHFQSDPDILTFPAEEDGYLLATGDEALLENSLARLSLPTNLRDGIDARLYRLDARIREEMPLSAPTVQFPNGPNFHGNRHLSRTGPNSAEVLIAWKSQPLSDPFTIEARLRSTDTFPIVTSTIVELPANPLQGPLFQVVRIDLELPERDGAVDLELRLRREDDTILPVAGMDDEGFLLLNRYHLEN